MPNQANAVGSKSPQPHRKAPRSGMPLTRLPGVEQRVLLQGFLHGLANGLGHAARGGRDSGAHHSKLSARSAWNARMSRRRGAMDARAKRRNGAARRHALNARTCSPPPPASANLRRPTVCVRLVLAATEAWRGHGAGAAAERQRGHAATGEAAAPRGRGASQRSRARGFRRPAGNTHPLRRVAPMRRNSTFLRKYHVATCRL